MKHPLIGALFCLLPIMAHADARNPTDPAASSHPARNPTFVVDPHQGDPAEPGEDWWNLMKPHSVLIGGASVGVAAKHDYNANGQLYVLGSADGVGGQGCLLCVLDTNASVTHESVGLNTAWVNGVVGISSYGIADDSVLYIGSGNREPELILDVDHYTATQVVLKHPLTQDQEVRIHYGQYILTNSVDAPVAAPVFSTSSDHPSPNFYASVIVNVADPTHINVKGWAVPGVRTIDSHRIPSSSRLDTVWTNFGRPIVGIGAVTATGVANWRLDLSKASRPGSFTRDVGFAEFDLYNDQAPGQYWGGLFAVSVGGNAPTADSWVWAINAPQYPTIFSLGLGANAWGVRSPSFMFHGNAGVSVAQRDFEMSENAAMVDGLDNVRLISYLRRLDDKRIGIGSAELYWGGYKGGAMGAPPPVNTSGQGLGAVGFGIGGNVGSISLCGSSTGQPNAACGLTVNSAGNTSVTGNLSVADSIGASGVKAKGAAIFSGSLVIPVGTPASASASCRQGQMEMDGTYVYSCVAPNSWHRVRNGATW